MRAVKTNRGAMTGLCLRIDNISGQYPIELFQQGVDQFTVRYGEEIQKNLTYAEAARGLGFALMHALACAGRLDNSNSPLSRV